MKQRGITLIELLVAFAILAIILILVFNHTSFGIEPADFSRIMAQEGVQNAVQGSYQLGACSEGDIYNSAFSGIKNGYHVNGVICKGVYKAYTVRYF